MISEDYLFSQMELLHVAFDRPMRRSKAEIAYGKLKQLLKTEEQVKLLFERAIELESLPTVKQLIDLAKMINPKVTIPPIARKIVECQCGQSFSISWDMLQKLTRPVRCPGQFYRICKRFFQPAEIEILFRP